MAGDNSVPRFTNPGAKEIQDTAGIVNFTSANGQWNTTIGGLVLQGGLASASGAVSYSIVFQKQVLFISMNGATASAITNIGFTASSAGYWLAIGV